MDVGTRSRKRPHEETRKPRHGESPRGSSSKRARLRDRLPPMPTEGETVNCDLPSKYYESPGPSATKKLVHLHKEFESTVLYLGRNWSEREMGVVSPSLSFNRHDSHQDIETAIVESDLLSPLKSSHCYQVMVEPETFHTLSGRTSVGDGGKCFHFSGFLLVSRTSLDQVPSTFLQRYSQEYNIKLKPHPPVTNFVMKDVLLLHQYLFVHLLELYQCYHELLKPPPEIFVVPRFTRQDKGWWMASGGTILHSFMDDFIPLKPALKSSYDKLELSKRFAESLAYNRALRPHSIRIDRLDWLRGSKGPATIVHFSSAKHTMDKERSKKEADYIFLHHQSVSGKLSRKDYFKLKALRQELRQSQYRFQKKKETIIEVDEANYFLTHIYTDLIQHCLLLPNVLRHAAFHRTLPTLEQSLGYSFKDRQLLQLSLTHPSYVIPPASGELYNSLCCCGIRRPRITPEAGDIRAQRPKSGLQGLLEALEPDRAENKDRLSPLQHNERLEFLGDAVLEYLCSVHLYHTFPEFSDGRLVIFRGALICNKHLATVAKRFELDKYFLKAECSELSGSDDYSHALANTLESIIGAVYLDGGLPPCQQLIGLFFFPEEDLNDVWMNYSLDPLQTQYPNGDRDTIPQSDILKKFTTLEEKVGVEFTHIRLLARAFTHPSFGFTNLCQGNYQRMEFLGDAILQLVTSDHVYRTFPAHHEGHLTAFRVALVHNKLLAKVSQELTFPDYILRGKDQRLHLTEKVKADLVESFAAALFLDKGLEHARTFCKVCLFPRLKQSAKGLQFIDPKSRLQHAIVFTCRKRGWEVEPPVYRVLKTEGMVHSLHFTVGVFFHGKQLATGTGKSSQEAGMDAAEKALASTLIQVPDSLLTDKDRSDDESS